MAWRCSRRRPPACRWSRAQCAACPRWCSMAGPACSLRRSTRPRSPSASVLFSLTGSGGARWGALPRHTSPQNAASRPPPSGSARPSLRSPHDAARAAAPRRHGVERRGAYPGPRRPAVERRRAGFARRPQLARGLPRHAGGDQPTDSLRRDGRAARRAAGAARAAARRDGLGKLAGTAPRRAAQRARRRDARQRSPRPRFKARGGREPARSAAAAARLARRACSRRGADARRDASRRDPRRARRGLRLGHARPAAGEARLERVSPVPPRRRRQAERRTPEREMKAFFYVQHLLGIGHLKRAATLARALAEHGFEVTLASGGPRVPGIDLEKVKLIQLPPASAADMTFKALLDESGLPVNDAWKARRREALLAAWRGAAADVLLIELFPFGRRQMRFELLPLLEAARAGPRPPLIVSSVRDLIGAGQGDARRQDEMLEAAQRFFDRILVHGDPQVVGFERSFRHAARLAPKLHYTGYVVADLKIERSEEHTS